MSTTIDNDITFNTSSRFPNLDQLSDTAASIYIKEHEFQQEVSTMIAQIESLLSADSDTSAIAAAKSQVAAALNSQTDEIQLINSTVKGTEGYIASITSELQTVESAYEQLYSKIYSAIKTINANVQNRASVFDTVTAYGNRLNAELYKLYGKTSPYKDGRSVINSPTDKYTVTVPKTNIQLRDVDEGIRYITYPVVINPQQLDASGNNICQKVPIKIFEFTPINNGTAIPSFLIDVIISGDLFSYKGFISSCTKDAALKDGSKPRGVDFEAEYFLNQDLPYSLKVLYDKTRNKIVVAFKFDTTTDEFTSIVKFDCSVNLLVGRDLAFADPNTTMSY